MAIVLCFICSTVGFGFCCTLRSMIYHRGPALSCPLTNPCIYDTIGLFRNPKAKLHKKTAPLAECGSFVHYQPNLTLSSFGKMRQRRSFALFLFNAPATLGRCLELLYLFVERYAQQLSVGAQEGSEMLTANRNRIARIAFFVFIFCRV